MGLAARAVAAYPCRVTPARLVTLRVRRPRCAPRSGRTRGPPCCRGSSRDWHLSNSEAGWITGVFYAAYTLAVPVLVTLTDRVDARAVYLSGVALTVASHLGFAAFADGFWSAMVARAVAGVGWAGRT